MQAPAAEPFCDVLIRGAGPIGCTLALALRESGLRVAVVSAGGSPAGFRPIALSYASRLILERVGVWRALAATPIETVHVSQQGGFGRARMDATDAGVPALGYVVSYSALGAALLAEAGNTGMQMLERDIPARCVVHAEGMAADAEETRYSQDAVVGLVKLSAPAGTTAFERFTPDGPLALLPFGADYALIWSTNPASALRLAEMAEGPFVSELAAVAGRRIGLPVRVEARAVQPLVLRVRPRRIGERSVYVGNAAQTLHPVAGQGLNLGLRDAWDLAQILRESADPGDAGTLARYASQRSGDARATINVTDFLARAFTGSDRIARSARGLALCALDILPAPRRFFARRMIYGPSALP